MDVLYFEPRDPFPPRERDEGEEKTKEGRAKSEQRRNVGRQGEKVERNEKARGDGLAPANHVVCIHLHRILFLRSRVPSLPYEDSRDSSLANGDKERRKKNH